MGGRYRCGVRGDSQVWRGAHWGDAEAWVKRGRKGEKICPFFKGFVVNVGAGGLLQESSEPSFCL